MIGSYSVLKNFQVSQVPKVKKIVSVNKENLVFQVFIVIMVKDVTGKGIGIRID